MILNRFQYLTSVIYCLVGACGAALSSALAGDWNKGFPSFETFESTVTNLISGTRFWLAPEHPLFSGFVLKPSDPTFVTVGSPAK